MENKIKNWIERELNFAIYNETVDCNATFTKCYGVIMFAINEMFDEYNENLVAWWDNEIYPKFKALQKFRYEQEHAPFYTRKTGAR